MVNIDLICIGKLKEKFWVDAVNEYTKRLSGYCKFNIIELPEEKSNNDPSESEIYQIIEAEGKRILQKIKSNSYVVSMAIEGKNLDSIQLEELISTKSCAGYSNFSFIIGGSWGISDEVKNRSDFKLSMSKMTFPHQLARVMFCEQIYRSFKISKGEKYHK